MYWHVKYILRFGFRSTIHDDTQSKNTQKAAKSTVLWFLTCTVTVSAFRFPHDLVRQPIWQSGSVSTCMTSWSKCLAIVVVWVQDSAGTRYHMYSYVSSLLNQTKSLPCDSPAVVLDVAPQCSGEVACQGTCRPAKRPHQRQHNGSQIWQWHWKIQNKSLGSVSLLASWGSPEQRCCSSDLLQLRVLIDQSWPICKSYADEERR